MTTIQNLKLLNRLDFLRFYIDGFKRCGITGGQSALRSTSKERKFRGGAENSEVILSE